MMMLVGTPRAHAQERREPAGDATERARARFVEAAALAREGRWSEALDRFEQSAALRPHAVATFNIAYCERALGHDTRAWYRFRRAVEEDARAGGAELSEALRRGAEEYAAELETRLVHAIVTVEPGDASVSVDGRPLEPIVSSGARPVLAVGVRPPGPPEPAPQATFEVILDPGRHTFFIRKGDTSATIEEQVAAGESLRLSFPAQPPAPRPRQAAQPLVPSPDGMPTQRVGALVVGGVGLASLTAGVVFGALTVSRWNEAVDACPARSSCPDDRGLRLSQEARQYGNVATVALVTSGTAAVGAIVLWLTAPGNGATGAAPVARRVPARFEW